MNMYIYTIVGIVIAVLAALSRNSMRRLIVTASISLIIAFLAFPFTTSLGALSRQTVMPTLAAISAIFPLFIFVLIAALVPLFTNQLGPRPSAIAAIAAGGVTLLSMALWSSQTSKLVKLAPLNGLMEALTGLVLGTLIILIAWNRKNLRYLFVVLGLAIGISSFWWLSSASGQKYLPNVKGYYKIIKNVPTDTEERIIKDFNESLEGLNKQRKSIGLNLLEPIQNITGLDGQKLPRAAADEGLRLLEPKRLGYGSLVYFLMAGLLIGSGGMLLIKPHLRSESDGISGLMLALLFSALIPAFSATDFSIQRIIKGWPFLQNFLDRSWPPNLDALQQVASQMLVTLEIAFLGTFLAAIFALPLSFLASRNLTQGNRFMRLIFILTRSFFNVDRGIDTLILALVFVAAVGLGPFAGILAMAIHSIADLGKVFSESIENVDKGPIEALEAAGASGTNVVRWAIFPQVAPLLASWVLYRFEINFRVSIVLGLVGAGGIGFVISEKMASGQYDQMIVAILAIILVVNIIDFTSSWLRGKLM